MLYRNRKQADMNGGKWIGIGGRIEPGESPDECIRREVLEETGLILRSSFFHGIIHFRSDEYEDEEMYLYSSSDIEPADPLAAAEFAETGSYTPPDCDEGELHWIEKSRILELPTWAGDRAFLEEMLAGAEEITMTLRYEGDKCIVTK